VLVEVEDALDPATVVETELMVDDALVAVVDDEALEVATVVAVDNETVENVVVIVEFNVKLELTERFAPRLLAK
jgi:hypothetical protein